MQRQAFFTAQSGPTPIRRTLPATCSGEFWLGPLGPAQLCRGRARIGTNFNRRWTNHVARNVAINACSEAFLEEAFYPAIFPGMKRQNCDAPASFETLRQKAQERLQRAELVVDLNAQRLKSPAQSGLAFARTGQRRLDN